MAKKEKIVDLKSRPEKISEDQLKKVQDIINDIDRTKLELGSMELRKHEAMHGVAGLKDELTLMQGEFEKNYGTADINIQDGTINYQKEDGKTD